MRIRTDKKCFRCNSNGIETPLYYDDIEPKIDDTWHKELSENNDERCRHCAVKDDKEMKNNKQVYLHHMQKLEDYHIMRIEKFLEFWNDPAVADLAWPQRYTKICEVRGITTPEEGFELAGEMLEVIRDENQISFSISKTLEDWNKENEKRTSAYTRHEATSFANELLAPYEKIIAQHKRSIQISQLRSDLNTENERLFDERKPKMKLVNTPGFKNVYGKSSPRVHLLVTEDTYVRRQNKFDRQIKRVEDNKGKETEVYTEVQEALAESEKTKAATQLEQQGIKDNIDMENEEK